MNIKELAQKLGKEQSKFKELEREFSIQKTFIQELRDEMLFKMQEAGTDSYSSDQIGISVRKSSVPVAKDWDKIYSFIKENEAFDLLQRRLAPTAWRDRVEEEGPIDGVDIFNKTTLYIKLKEVK